MKTEDREVWCIEMFATIGSPQGVITEWIILGSDNNHSTLENAVLQTQCLLEMLNGKLVEADQLRLRNVETNETLMVGMLL